MPWQDFPIFDELEAQYGQERSLTEFFAWFAETHRRLKEVAMACDPDARKRLDDRKNCLKNFYEEALPIETFLRARPDLDVRSIRLNPGNDAWDAQLTNNAGAVLRIEVTSTLDGEGFRVAMAFLRKFRRSPSSFFAEKKKALWEIFNTKTDLPDDVFQAYKLTEEISTQAERTAELIEQKAAKAYARNTHLLVFLDNVDTELDLDEVKRQVHVSDLARTRFAEIHLVRCSNPAILIL